MALFTLIYLSTAVCNTQIPRGFHFVESRLIFFRVSGLSDPRFTFSQINTFFFPKQAPSLEVTFWGVGLDYRSLSSRIAQLLLEKSRITGKLLHIELYNIIYSRGLCQIKCICHATIIKFDKNPKVSLCFHLCADISFFSERKSWNLVPEVD